MEKLYPLNDRVRRSSKKKKILVVAQRVIRDFVNNTSIHGLKYLGERTAHGGPIVKLFWVATLVLAFVGSGLMLRVFWDRYQSDPSITVIETTYAPSFLATFPALTVCSVINPTLDKRREVLAKLRLPKNITKEEADYLIHNIFGLANLNAQLFEKQSKLNDIFNMNKVDIIDVLKILRSDCHDFVESCWWNEKSINCRQYFRTNYAFNGLCCSFNYNLEDAIDPKRNKLSTANDMIPSVGYGPHSGLTLVFKENQFIKNYSRGTIIATMMNVIGAMLYIHQPLQYPDSFNIILQAGQEMQLGIVAWKQEKDPGVSRKNELPCVLGPDVHLKYMQEYGATNCHNSCRMRAAWSFCGCIPWQFAPFAIYENKTICKIGQIKCLRKYKKEIWSVMYEQSTEIECICPEECRKEAYRIRSTTIALATSPKFAPSPIYRNVSNKNSVLRLFMTREFFDNLGNLRITNEIYTLSSVGGIFSLFLGCSILSLFEIIYFLFLFIISCYTVNRGN